MCNEPGCPIPYGYCHCGCGGKTKISPETSRHHGFVKDEPRRFIKGHNTHAALRERTKATMTPPNPSGFCWCGCGEKTPVAAFTSRKYGWVKGEHLKYIKGHRAIAERQGIVPPNPSGLCMCRCGGKTPIAPQTDRRKGWLIGHHVRFIHGHEKGQTLPIAEQFSRRVLKGEGPDACWEWSGRLHPSGYPRTGIGGKARNASHVAYELASGEPLPKGSVILHTCDNPKCVRNDEPGTYEVNGLALPRFGHLALGTKGLNSADMTAKGRHHKGHLPHPGTFTDAEVQAIRYAYKHRDVTLVTMAALARRTGRGFYTIQRLIARKSYTHVPDTEKPPANLAAIIGVPTAKPRRVRSTRGRTPAVTTQAQLEMGF